MDEARLIGQLRASSRRAFDEIYRLYAARLYAFCLQYCKVREDAEEIVEDVFVKLWTVRKDIRSEQSLKSLLFTISRRQLINAYRRTVNAPEFAGYVEMLGVMSAEDASAHIEYDELKFFAGGIKLDKQRIDSVAKLLADTPDDRKDSYNDFVTLVSELNTLSG